jgi:hypothetical protein
MLYAHEYEERVVAGDEYIEVSWVCTSVSFKLVILQFVFLSIY